MRGNKYVKGDDGEKYDGFYEVHTYTIPVIFFFFHGVRLFVGSLFAHSSI